MNLYELIQYIPDFIEDALLQQASKQVKLGEAPPMIGKFYLGLNYDYQQIWMQNQSSKGRSAESNKDSRAKDSGVAIYPCSQEKEYFAKNNSG